jgi:hypothetical protein
MIITVSCGIQEILIVKKGESRLAFLAYFRCIDNDNFTIGLALARECEMHQKLNQLEKEHFQDYQISIRVKVGKVETIPSTFNWITTEKVYKTKKPTKFSKDMVVIKYKFSQENHGTT